MLVRRRTTLLKGAAAGILLLVAAVSCAQAQTVPCTGPTGGNCVPVVNVTTASIPAGSGSAGYPPGSTPWVQSATGTTAGTTATQSGVSGKFTYLCGFIVGVGTATAAITVNITTAGLANNLTLPANAPVTAATATAGPTVSENLAPFCPVGSSLGGSLSVAAGALGAGGVSQSVFAWGYQQ